MTNEDQIRGEKLQYDINREAAKYQFYHQVKLINMNILLVKKYWLLIKSKYLVILLWEKPLRTNKNN